MVSLSSGQMGRESAPTGVSSHWDRPEYNSASHGSSRSGWRGETSSDEIVPSSATHDFYVLHRVAGGLYDVRSAIGHARKRHVLMSRQKDVKRQFLAQPAADVLIRFAQEFPGRKVPFKSSVVDAPPAGRPSRAVSRPRAAPHRADRSRTGPAGVPASPTR